MFLKVEPKHSSTQLSWTRLKESMQHHCTRLPETNSEVLIKIRDQSNKKHVSNFMIKRTGRDSEDINQLMGFPPKRCNEKADGISLMCWFLWGCAGHMVFVAAWSVF